MKKVLIALDYDPTAKKVAEVGFDFAKTMGAEVVLLHVISDPVYYSSTDYSPIMGFTGYLNADPLELNTMEVLKTASLNFFPLCSKLSNTSKLGVPGDNKTTSPFLANLYAA